MTTSRSGVWLWVAAVIAVQLGVLIHMVWTRADLLISGREITVDVVPVDPRDIFRGDYVVLAYPFSTASSTDGNVTLPAGAYRNRAIYATLVPDAAAGWKQVRFDLDRPSNDDPTAVVIKGRVADVWSHGDAQAPSGRIRYGIESYFVPEGTGRDLEVLVRDKKIRAVLAVGDDGTAAIKALEVEGRRIHEQAPL